MQLTIFSFIKSVVAWWLAALISGAATLTFAASPIMGPFAYSTAEHPVASEKEQGVTANSGIAPLHFTEREKTWIKQHPRVRVVFSDSYVPVAFIDNDENFRGIGADLLTVIRLRTGISFVVRNVDSVAKMQQMLAEGEVDMIGALMEGSVSELVYSHPWISSDYILLTENSRQAPVTLSDMQGKKLAVRRGSPVNRWIAAHYPQITLIEKDDVAPAVELITKGKVEGAVTTRLNAQYQLRRYDQGRLRIAGKVASSPATIAFAMLNSEPELLSILNKVLESLPEEDVQRLETSWDSEHVLEGGRVWRTWHSMILQFCVLSLAILLVSLGWGVRLRHQIRQRERAQLALSEHLEFMYALMDGMPYPIYVRDRRGILIACNSRYLQEVNVTKEQALHKDITMLPLPEALAQAMHQDYQHVMEKGKPMMCDRVISYTHMKQNRTVFHWMVPYHNSQGDIAGVYSGWLDVTERQQLLEQLSEARDRAEAASRAKTAFLSTMSHEIRTPLNAIIGILELAIKKSERDNQPLQLLDVAFDAANGLVDLVGDILDIARIESGHMVLHVEQAEVVSLTQSVIRIFSGVAAQKGLTLTFDITGGEQRLLMIDPLRYKQIVSNILSNAMKFTVEGLVKVRLDHQLLPSNEIDVKVTISDTGPGISQQAQTRLFQPFSQLDFSQQSARQGAGLGLVICRTLCEMMQGSLQLESEPGQGTTVMLSLRLPCAKATALPIAHEKTGLSTGKSMNILIVDDYRPNRLLMRQQLQYLGHRVSEAEDGCAGLDLWQHQQLFDVVIIDSNMPGMDGYTLAQKIRHLEASSCRPRCLLLGFTANAQPEVHTRCLEAGMDGCLFKPSTINDLAKWLNSAHMLSPPQLPTELPALLQVIEPLTGGLPESNAQFLQGLLDSTYQDIELLTKFKQDNDLLKMTELAHKIKGVARIIDTEYLLCACEKLEACNHTDGSIDGAVDDATEQLSTGLKLFIENICEAMAENQKRSN